MGREKRLDNLTSHFFQSAETKVEGNDTEKTEMTKEMVEDRRFKVVSEEFCVTKLRMIFCAKDGVWQMCVKNLCVCV